MKKIDYLIILSTESGENQEVHKEDIIDQHTQPKPLGGFGWNRPGIDYLVTLDGELETILPEENPSAVDLWGISEGKNGLNGIAKYIAFAGGTTPKGMKEKDTRSEAQNETLSAVVKFYIARFPNIQVLGMNQVPAKRGVINPAFKVSEWLKSIGVREENIFGESKKNKE